MFQDDVTDSVELEIDNSLLSRGINSMAELESTAYLSFSSSFPSPCGIQRLAVSHLVDLMYCIEPLLFK
jgi:hypothetical protein